jgi:hypothetical protein
MMDAKPVPAKERPKAKESWTPCSVCQHDQLAVIDGLLTLKISLRSIAWNYGLSCSSLLRHKQRHLPTFPDVEKARQTVDGRMLLREPLDMLRRVDDVNVSHLAESIRDMLWERFEAALRPNDPLDELRRALAHAVGYLCRVKGRGGWYQEENLEDARRALETLESWGRSA